MSPKFILMSGYLLVVMGIADLVILDMPTWLGVWNVAIGVAGIAYGTLNRETEK